MNDGHAPALGLSAGLLLLASLVLPCVGCRREGTPAPAGSASLAPAEVAKTKVVLRVLPSRVGERWRHTRKSELKLSVEFWQDGEKLGANEMSKSEEYDRTVDVLGLLGGAPAKIRVHYDKYRSSEVSLDKPPRQDAHLEGQTYLLDVTEGVAKTLSGDGKPLLGEEKESVEKLHGGLGEDDPTVTVLASQGPAPGESKPLKERLFRALIGSKGDLKSGTITLARTVNEGGRDTAVYEWSADMHTEEDQGLEIDWHLKGELTVGIAPAVVLHARVSGSLDASGHTKRNGEKVTMAGAGSMEDERTATLLTP